MDIYVVYGGTGQYENYTEWLVCAFKNEEEAKKYRFQCQTRANELIEEYKDSWDIPYGVNQYDPDMQVDCDSVSYNYYTVDLRG